MLRVEGRSALDQQLGDVLALCVAPDGAGGHRHRRSRRRHAKALAREADLIRESLTGSDSNLIPEAPGRAREDLKVPLKGQNT